jgi:RNA polymerase sigma-70 factor (ECF subfamily)
MGSAASTITPSDEELMDRVRRTDDCDAFGRLYDRHASAAFGFVRSLGANSARSEEIVQEGFISIWRGRKRFSPEAGTFKSWWMTIVRHCAYDAFRADTAQKRPQPSHGESQTAPSPLPSPEAQAIRHDETELLHSALTQLPDAQAEVIALAFYGELSHSEISQRLNLPTGTVKGRMRLGLEKLRGSLDDDA